VERGPWVRLIIQVEWFASPWPEPPAERIGENERRWPRKQGDQSKVIGCGVTAVVIQRGRVIVGCNVVRILQCLARIVGQNTGINLE